MPTASDRRTADGIPGVRAAVAAGRARGPRIGFVWAVRALYVGPSRPVVLPRRLAGFVLLSIFVRPLQFGPGEDFSRYPRDEEAGVAKALGRCADLIFVPSVEAM